MHKEDLQALVAAMLVVIQHNADSREGITRLWGTLQKMSEVISGQNTIMAQSATKIEALEAQLGLLQRQFKDLTTQLAYTGVPKQ